MRSLDLQRRQVMFDFDLFQPLASGGDMLPEFLLLVDLQSFAFELLGIRFDFAFERADFLVNRADGGDQTLPGGFLEMKSTNLLRDFESRARQLASITQQLLRTLAARDFLLVGKTLKLLQASFVESANVLQSFDRPLQILFAAILVLLGFHLVRERNDVANVELTCRQLIADSKKLHHCDRRTGNRFFRALLSALDSFRD